MFHVYSNGLFLCTFLTQEALDNFLQYSRYEDISVIEEIRADA